MKYFLCLFSFLLILKPFAFSQGYDIKIKINGLKDSSLFLGYYLADKKYIIDTARINKQGIAEFKKSKALESGLYLVILPNRTFADILISEDQNFAMESDTAFLEMKLDIRGAKESQVFNDYKKFAVYNQKQLADLRKRQTTNKAHKDSIKNITEKINKIKKNVDLFNEKLIRENPSTFVSKFIKATIDIEVPPAPRNEKGIITDSLFQYRYFKKHYFDNIDFTDERMMRTPFLQSKIEKFFTKTVVQIPDSIVVEIDKLIEKTSGNEKMKRYVTAFLLNYYESSKYMGMENVMIAIADKYYLSGKASWTDTTFIRKLKKHVETIRPNLMGNQAPDLSRMETNIGEWATLSLVKAKAIVLVFWEPNCSHCKKTIPKLHDIYKKFKDKGMAVFAVYTQHDTTEWNKFIEEHDLTDWINVYDRYNLSNFRALYDIYTTPTIYILDDKKTIVARKIDIEMLEKFVSSIADSPDIKQK